MPKPTMRAIIEGRFGKRVRLYVNGKKVHEATHYGDKDEIDTWIRAVANEHGAKWVK